MAERGLPSGLPARPPDRQDGAQPDHRGRRQGAAVRAARRRRARRPGARRQGRPGRHRPLRRRPRLQHEPVRRHAGGDRQRDRRRSATRRSCSPGMALGRRARDASRGRTAPGSAATGATRPRSRRSRTSPSTRTAPARCRPASRAGSTRRPSTATEAPPGAGRASARRQAGVDRDLDLVATFSVAEQGRSTGFMPQSLCVITTRRRVDRRRRRPAARSNASGRVSPSSVRSPSTRSPPPSAGSHRGRAERDGLPLQDLVVDRLLDVGLVVVVERLHPAGALDARAASRVDVERDARRRGVLADRERRLPAR